jgi:hypothetical protein
MSVHKQGIKDIGIVAIGGHAHGFVMPGFGFQILFALHILGYPMWYVLHGHGLQPLFAFYGM